MRPTLLRPDDERQRPGAGEHGPTRRPGDPDRHRLEEQRGAERRREQEDGGANDGAQGDLRQMLKGRDEPGSEVLRFEPERTRPTTNGLTAMTAAVRMAPSVNQSAPRRMSTIPR